MADRIQRAPVGVDRPRGLDPHPAPLDLVPRGMVVRLAPLATPRLARRRPGEAGGGIGAQRRA